MKIDATFAALPLTSAEYLRLGQAYQVLSGASEATGGWEGVTDIFTSLSPLEQQGVLQGMYQLLQTAPLAVQEGNLQYEVPAAAAIPLSVGQQIQQAGVYGRFLQFLAQADPFGRQADMPIGGADREIHIAPPLTAALGKVRAGTLVDGYEEGSVSLVRPPEPEVKPEQKEL